jgi:hypothetical protein
MGQQHIRGAAFDKRHSPRVRSGEFCGETHGISEVKGGKSEFTRILTDQER